MKFVQDTSKFWYKPDISRDQGKYWSWTGDFQSDNTPLCKGLLLTQYERDESNFGLSLFPPSSTAITVLKDKEPGSFVVRDSHSFRGAYGLAMKVATPPPSVIQQSKKCKERSHLVFDLCSWKQLWHFTENSSSTYTRSKSSTNKINIYSTFHGFSLYIIISMFTSSNSSFSDVLYGVYCI